MKALDHKQADKLHISPGVMATIAVCILAAALALTGDYQDYPEMHRLLDAGMFLLSGILALFFWNMSIHQEGLPKLLAISFAVTSVLEFIHALVGLEWSGSLAFINQAADVLRPGTWPPPAYILPIGIGYSIWVLYLDNGKQKHSLWFVLVIIILSIVLLTVFDRLPRYTEPGWLHITRPTLIPVPLLWTAVILVCWRKLTKDRILQPLVLMATVIFIGQIFMLFSRAPHDTPAMVAHLGRVGGYLILLLSMMEMASMDMVQLIHSEEKIRGMNMELEQRVVERTSQLQAEVTERKQAEAMRDKLASIIETSEDAVLSKTLDGVITSWNRGSERLYGYSAKEAIGQSISLIIPPDRPNELPSILERIQHGEHIEHYETVRVPKDGKRVHISISVSPMTDSAGRVIGASTIARDITERKQAEEALRDSEVKFSKAFHSSPLSFVITTLDGKFSEVNSAFCELIGYSEEEVIGKTSVDLELLSEQNRKRLVAALTSNGGSVRNFEVQFNVRDGSIRDILYSLETISFHGALHRLSTGVDITVRKRAEKQLAQLNRLYATLSQVNQTIVRVKDSDDLYQSICNLAVQFGGFSLAWIGLLDMATGDIRPVAANGLDLENWPFENINIHQGALRNALSATAIRTSSVITSDDVQVDERIQAVHDLTEKYAYRSSAAIPFQLRGKTVGVVALVSGELGFFKAEQELRLLEEMGADISFALDTMETEVERKWASEQLSESEERLRQVWESTSDAMALSDVNGIMLSANPAALRLYGYTSEQIIGQSIAVTLPEEAREQVLEQYKAIFLSEIIPPTFENIVRRVDGAERIAESSITFLTNVTGQRTAMLSTVRDITDRKHAEDALRTSEQRYRGLFEDSPISIWEEDFSLVKQRLEALRGQGVSDFRSYFASHPEEMLDCASLVKITDVNKAGLQMYHAQNREDMLGSLREVITSNTLTSFHEELINITEGKTTFHWEGTDRTLIGEPIEVNLSWSVAPGHEHDYSRVIVSTIDITERKRAQEKTLRQLNYLTALQDIDRTIASAFDMQLSLNELISKAVSLLSVDAAAILLLNDTRKTLDFAAGDGFRTDKIKTASINLEKSYAGRAAVKQRMVEISNLQDEQNDLFISSFLDGDDFVSYYGVPLIVTGKTIGVMEVFQRSLIKRDQEWLDFLNALAGQAAIAISNAQLFDHLQQSHKELVRAYDSTIEGWSAALDLRDKETEGHSQRVTEMTINLARNMGVGENELLQIRRGALLHDIGKLGIPDHILLKPGRLTDDEWVTMRKHPIYAYDMLSSVEYLKPALDIPYAHHEKWDGTGYPRKLKGEEIPFEARIFAIVDVWDALRSNRPYREGWPQEKVMDYLRAESGKHFDPQVVKAFLSLTIGIE